MESCQMGRSPAVELLCSNLTCTHAAFSVPINLRAGLFWNLVFALYRLASQHTNTIFKATAVNISKWARWPFFELVMATIWWVLWLASAAGVSSTTEAKVAAKGQVKGLEALQALMAFLW